MLGDVQLERLKQDLLDARDNGVTWKFVMLRGADPELRPDRRARRPLRRLCGRAQRTAEVHRREPHRERGVRVGRHALALGQQPDLPGPLRRAADREQRLRSGCAVARRFPLLGPLVAPTAAALGVITPAQLAFYNSLPIAPDTDNIPNDKDDFVEFILDTVLGRAGLRSDRPRQQSSDRGRQDQRHAAAGRLFRRARLRLVRLQYRRDDRQLLVTT